MTSSFELLSGGTAVLDFDTTQLDVEIEENVDLPGAFRVTLPIRVSAAGDYDTASDPRFGPLSNIAVTATGADGQAHCLIDGYVLSQDLHLDAAAASSKIKISGQDSSW